MDKSKAAKALTDFPQLNKIEQWDEFLIHQQILRYRLMGLTETSIYMATGAGDIPMEQIRDYVKEVDSWIESGVLKASEHLNEKEMDRLLSMRRLDYVLEERVVLYQTVTDDGVKLRVLNAMRDDIDRRAELLGLKVTLKKETGDGGPTDLPDMSLEDLMASLSKSMGKDNKKK